MKQDTIVYKSFFVWMLIILIFTSKLYSQEQAIVSPSLLNHKWNAMWISYPDASLKDYGVFHFRKKLNLTNIPKSFIVNVSGDIRYRLFVNGTEVCNGPASSDLANWNFETVDISESLKLGDNIISAVVWNFGEFKHLAQMTNKTAFILQGNSSNEEIVNTNGTWKVFKDEAYIKPTKRPTHTTVGPSEKLEGRKYPYGWNQVGFDDNSWKQPKIIGKGIPKGKFTFWDWALVPRNIPFTEYKFQRINEIERVENIKVNSKFIDGKAPIIIPAHKKVKILLDQTFLTNAYPELIVSGGKGSEIKINYSEALIDANGVKGNRNIVKGKSMPNYIVDIFYPDGGKNRKYQPLWFRTYRYIEINVNTGDEALTINDIYGFFTAYPFKEKAVFKSSNTELRDIWDTGWRTARLCAGETYYDCPYYEQLQYVGDTRIQALISLYVTGDDRLMRKAIDQFHNSQLPDGLTQSRFPSVEPQVIPPFSLIWVEMIHDYWMLRDDNKFVKKYVNGINNVLHWYEQQIDETGMLGPMDWWNFVDWSFGSWNNDRPLGGTPTGAIDGNSSIITLKYAHTLQLASEMFDNLGYKNKAEDYKNRAKSLIKSTYKYCWDKNNGLLADTPDKKTFSQHANIVGILTGSFNKEENEKILRKILEDKEVTETTFYYKFYLVEAIRKAGLSKDYFDILNDWKEMIDIGLTTFAETPEPTRSDCHAWSASPNYHFLSYVCGIIPASPGFKTVIIEPHLGELNYIEVIMPHYKGDILVKLKKNGKMGGIIGEIVLPEGLTGKFIWNGKEKTLKEGKNICKYF